MVQNEGNVQRQPTQQRSWLPAELVWVYLIAPIPTAPLLVDELFSQPAPQMLRSFLMVSVPFAVFPMAFHWLYRGPIPRLLSRGGLARFEWPIHALVGTLVPVLLTPVLRPMMSAIKGVPIPPSRLVIPFIVISWAFLFPGLVIQRLRSRVAQGELRTLEARRLALSAELEALQARTNPHFFFNSINTVASLIPEDPDLAERTLERLADIVRYALDASRLSSVRLEREIEVVRDYLAIQKLRFNGRLHVELDLDPAVMGMEVPPLILQPLVENALLHGLSGRNGGALRLAVRMGDSRIEIHVSDDGPGPDRSNHRGAQSSLRDLRQRMRLLYGEDASLELTRQASGGCVAHLILPSNRIVS
jgi:two-component system sensor histidine kinase AlgZ